MIGRDRGGDDGLRLLILSDIHGNNVALRAIMSEQPRYDGLVCLGDYLWTSLGNREIMGWVRRSVDEGAVMVRGNSDRMEYYHRYGYLSRDDPKAYYEYLERFPGQAHISLKGRGFLAVHGFPKPPGFVSAFEGRRSLLPWMEPRYIRTVLDLDGVSVLLFGDLHLPYVAYDNDLLVVNPGSVGFNLDGDTRASFMILDIGQDRFTVQHYRVVYDVKAAVRDVELAHTDPKLGRERGISYESYIAGGKQGPFKWSSEWRDIQWSPPRT